MDTPTAEASPVMPASKPKTKRFWLFFLAPAILGLLTLRFSDLGPAIPVFLISNLVAAIYCAGAMTPREFHWLLRIPVCLLLILAFFFTQAALTFAGCGLLVLERFNK